jgi:hypothetical protein
MYLIVKIDNRQYKDFILYKKYDSLRYFYGLEDLGIQ